MRLQLDIRYAERLAVVAEALAMGSRKGEAGVVAYLIDQAYAHARQVRGRAKMAAEPDDW